MEERLHRLVYFDVICLSTIFVQEIRLQHGLFEDRGIIAGIGDLNPWQQHMHIKHGIGELLDLMFLFDSGAAFSIGTVPFISLNSCIKDLLCEL